MNRINLADIVLVGLSQSINVKGERCNRICHKGAKCNLCETNCPVTAIKVGDVGTKVNIDWDKCRLCGICINICPTGVFGIRQLGHKAFLDKYLERLSPEGILYLSCKECADKNGERLECLGILGLTEILYFYTHGATALTLAFGKCDQCENKYAKEVVEDEVAELHKLSPCFERLNGLKITREGDALTLFFPFAFERTVNKEKVEEDYTRRGAFIAVAQRIKNDALKSATFLTPQNIPDKTPIRLTKELTIKRQLFSEALTKLGKLLKDSIPVGPYFFEPVIDLKKCSYCGICARFCPTGALSMNEAKDKLLFTAAECVACGMCLYSCYHKLITTKKTVALTDYFEEMEL